jgi:hypothetical protein
MDMWKLCLLVTMIGCAVPDVSGDWRYEWRVRDNGGVYEGWDGVFRGTLSLEQTGTTVTGSIGYPDEDPATLFGDASLREKWIWAVKGKADDEGLTLDAPAPNTAWDDPWRFVLKGGGPWSGLAWAGDPLVYRGWTMALSRP